MATPAPPRSRSRCCTERINELTESPARAQQGPPLAPRPADAGRQAPPAAAVPRAQRTSSATAPSSPSSACVDDRQPASRPPTSRCATRTARTSRCRTSRAARSSSSSTRSTSARSAPTSSRSTRRSSRSSRRRASRCVGISVDHPYAHKAFQEKLGIDTTLLADFEPKGEVARAYGSYLDGLGIANRTLVLVDEDGKVAWAYESPITARDPRRQSHLRRARGLVRRPVMSLGQRRRSRRSGRDDHVRGDAGRDRLRRPRLPALRGRLGAAERAAERAASLSATSRSPASTRARRPCTPRPRRRRRRAPSSSFVDSLYADRGQVDDPHLWERVKRFGLDLDRFEDDRRSEAVAAAGSPRLRVRHPRRRRAAPRRRVRCLVALDSQVIENESSESEWPPTGRPEVRQLNEHV